jgi:tRNA-binding protein
MLIATEQNHVILSTNYMIAYDDFEKVDVRVGKIIKIEDFPEARKPAYKLEIDFGPEIGVRKSSAQITVHYTKDELIGRLVMGVVNFPPKQIGPFISECLTLGIPDKNGDVVLIIPTKEVPIGGKMF